MILLFTSTYCTWCNVVKRMIVEEAQELSGLVPVHEVDIEKHESIAKVYGVLMVPTLVAGSSVLSGVPSNSDLHSFILKAAAGSVVTSNGNDMPKIGALKKEKAEEQHMIEKHV
ncbi:hypothetical protein EU537_08925 [Candidatus Thorarchaeota archaeon]|nr:MAG: hypothetical protein EU537_08925 [Candidatus Thorarchaeota archaeon]